MTMDKDAEIERMRKALTEGVIKMKDTWAKPSVGDVIVMGILVAYTLLIGLVIL